MPQFKLEALKHNARDKRAPKMLYCKKEFNTKVKVTDWNLIQECQPIDTNPYNPKCYSLHHSHYDRLGSQDEPNLISETHDSLRSGVKQSPVFKLNPHRYVVNFYTYDNYKCGSLRGAFCPEVCADEYISTMQYSYQSPYPCEIKRLVMPATGSQNKHLAIRSECKFLDDNVRDFTKTLQDVKGFRQVSYNPCKGMYTDGTIIDKAKK